jgi:hypothetical protein
MRSLGGSRVEKKRCCLSSDILASYQRFDLAAEQKPQIASHLASCAAELKLLSKRPAAVEQLWEGTMLPPDDGGLAAAILMEDTYKTEKLVCQIYR